MVLFRLRNFVSFRHLSSNKLASVYASSRSVIDINHPNQSGLTMRCIESLLSGKKLLTSNANIMNEYIYDVSRVFVFDRSSPCFPGEFLDAPFQPISSDLKDYYSIDYWLSLLQH